MYYDEDVYSSWSIFCNKSGDWKRRLPKICWLLRELRKFFIKFRMALMCIEWCEVSSAFAERCSFFSCSLTIGKLNWNIACKPTLIWLVTNSTINKHLNIYMTFFTLNFFLLLFLKHKNITWDFLFL